MSHIVRNVAGQRAVTVNVTVPEGLTDKQSTDLDAAIKAAVEKGVEMALAQAEKDRATEDGVKVNKITHRFKLPPADDDPAERAASRVAKTNGMGYKLPAAEA